MGCLRVQDVVIIKRKNIPKLQKAITLLNNNGWNIKLTVIGKIINNMLKI